MKSEGDSAGLRKALVVEDEHSIAMLIAAIAQRAGFSVDHAADGAEAVRAMDDQDYAVVVLDLMLPRVNGWEVLKHIQEKGGCAGCVVVVSAGSDSDLAKIDASIVRKTIQKPFDVNDLEQILASIHRDAGGAPIVASSERLKIAAKDEESRSGEGAPSETATRSEVEEREHPE